MTRGLCSSDKAGCGLFFPFSSTCPSPPDSVPVSNVSRCQNPRGHMNCKKGDLTFSGVFFSITSFHLNAKISQKENCRTERRPPAREGLPHPLSWIPRDGKTMEVKTFPLPTLLSSALSFFFRSPQSRFFTFGIFIFSLYRQFFLLLLYSKTPHLFAGPFVRQSQFLGVQGFEWNKVCSFR